MEKSEVCISCGVKLVTKGSVFFPCPQCADTSIGRCKNCRDQSVKFQCPNCGFTGP